MEGLSGERRAGGVAEGGVSGGWMEEIFRGELLTKGVGSDARFVRRSEQRLCKDVLFGGASND